MSIAVDRVIHALELKDCNPQPSGDGHSSRCPVPAHEDRKPSLSIAEGDDGRVLLFCHGGCPNDEVVASMGLTMQDLFVSNNGVVPAAPRPPKKPARASAGPRTPKAPRGAFEIVDVYPYCDEDGVELFQACRLKPKDFRLRHVNGSGKFEWNAKGIRRVLYHLPELIAAPADAVIFVCEGERDVDRLRDLGMIATTSAMGASHWNLTDHTVLHGRPVVALADNDDDGRKYTGDIAASLHGRGGVVKVLELNGLAEHGDVSDWLDAGNDPADLDQLALEAPEWTPAEPAAPAADIEPVRSPSADAPMSFDEAQKLARRIFKLGDMAHETVIESCKALAEFFAEGADSPAAILGGKRGRVGFSYFAGHYNVTQQRIGQMAAAGRTWLDELEALNNVSSDPLADQISECHIRPTTKLPAGQRGQAIVRAFQIAHDRHAVHVAEREAEGRKPRRERLMARDVAQAVNEALPASTREDDGSLKLWERLKRDLVAAQSIPGYPRAIVDALKTIVQQARGCC